jgi:predicted nucleotidyltransferase
LRRERGEEGRAETKKGRVEESMSGGERSRHRQPPTPQHLNTSMPVRPEHIETVKRLAREYGATRLVVFGSAADDPETARDLDVAIDGVPGWTFFRMSAEIQEEIDVPVDVIPLDPSPFTDYIQEQGAEILLDAEPEESAS